MRTTFVRTLLELGLGNRHVVLLTADLGFKLFDEFRAALPAQFMNVGIAEQNMVGVAAGMSMSKKNVYCYSMSPFLTMRAFEAIRVNICYHNLNVKLVGVGGGLSYGLEGMTHHGTEDIAIMRALPNMTVVAPGDPIEAEAVVRESARYPGPLYIRLDGNNDPVIHKDCPRVVIGEGTVVHSGRDVAIFSTGTMLRCANNTVEILSDAGLRPTLISLHTVKPLDTQTIMRYASKSVAVFTIEEHSLIGGLGSAVAELLLERRYEGLFKRFGLPDQYGGAIGKADYLRQAYGLTSQTISAQIMSELKKTLGVKVYERSRTG